MDNIIFEEELVSEVVYEDILTLDERLTPRQQKRKVFNMMKKANIPVLKESEYEISFEKPDENQSIKFKVTHIYNKKIPYRITKEEVYEGTYVLDGIRITPEEQRQQVFNLMREDGFIIEDEDDYEISYEGVEDNRGISETQVTHFTVNKIRKEKLTDKEYETISDDENKEIKILYNEMVALREELLKTTEKEKVTELSQKVSEVTEKVDTIIEHRIQNYGSYEEKITEYNVKITELEVSLQEYIYSYEETYEMMKELMNNSEIIDIEERERQRERINEKSLTIKKEIEKTKKEISSLKSQRTRLKKDYETAKALEISAEDYNEIISSLRKKDILNAILEQKGLEEIVSISAKERTSYQKQQLKEAKEEIIQELAKLKREDERQSVLSSIEALYGIELQKVKKNGRERILVVNKKSYENIINNSKKLPEKIMKNPDISINYKPGDVPEDLQEVFKKEEKNDIKERYILFHNEEEEERIYTRKPVIERFHINPIGEEVKIEGTPAYEIDKEDALYVEKNANNNYSPYIVEHKKAKVVQIDRSPINEFVEVENNVREDKEIKERYIIYHNEENNNLLYARVPVLERFNIIPEGEEVKIEGTTCFPIEKEAADYIEMNATNKYSPYEVEHRTAKVEKQIVEPLKDVIEETKESPTKETIHEDISSASKGLMDRITIYREMNESNKFYARKPVFERFDVEAIGEPFRINGVVCFEIDLEDVRNIASNANNDYSPYIVSYEDVQATKEEKEEIDVMERIKVEQEPTKEHLEISNLEVNPEFKEELKDKKMNYNIIHKIPYQVKAAVDFFDRLSDKLISSEESKSQEEQFKENLKDLTDEELELLMTEYRSDAFGSELNTHTKSLAFDRLKEYGKDTIQKINNMIKEETVSLAYLLDGLKGVEEQEQTEQDEDTILSLEEERNEKIGRASSSIQVIMDAKKELERLLNCHIRDLEEEFAKKAQELEFTKDKDVESLSDSLKYRVENFARSLKNALINHNDIGIVQNFLGLESCYDEDFDHRGDIVGKRSIGSIYSSLLEKYLPVNKNDELKEMMEEESYDYKEEEKEKVR